MTEENRTLKRNLSNRHIQLIAIGGAIGTGLFMGSGKTIGLAGPSILFVYMIIGFILFFVMRAMGELLLSNLDYASFTDFCTDLLGNWAGFFVGWTYWLCWIVTGIADVIAISSYFSFWFPNLPHWASSLSVIFLLLSLNLVTVKLFGEIEFWFSMIKIITIITLIIIGFTMAFNHHPTSFGNSASFAHIWNDGNMFPRGVIGFFAGFQIAIFAFVGIELVGTTAAETKDPTISLPKAINAIPIRIIAFYVLALAAILCVTPYNNIVPDKSPFVEMFLIAGLPAAAGIINFVVLTAAASSANSGIYSTSRMLYGLAQNKVAPKFFARLSSRAVPANGLMFSCFCLLGGIVILYFNPNVVFAFTIATTISAILFMFIWSMMLFAYITYRIKRPQLHEQSNYKMPLGIPMSIISLLFFVFILALLSFEKDTRLALFLTPIWFLLLGFIWKFKHR